MKVKEQTLQRMQADLDISEAKFNEEKRKAQRNSFDENTRLTA